MARPIRDRMADVSVGGETSAQYFWLDVIPLREERYDRIMQTDSLNTHTMGSKFPDAAMPQLVRRARKAFGGII
ncbi:MAG: hypothetical protein MRJ67_11785 [Nitrospirales bacterium]|nr:hypothetical protein [Nitrospirales bacterium]